VFSVLNIVPLIPTFNAMLYKKTLAMRVVRWKSYHKKWLLAFLLHIMTVGGIASKGDFWKSHRFWFCHDDLNYYVGGFETKYEVDRPLVLVVCPIKKGTNFT
jgi:hypothetical protein